MARPRLPSACEEARTTAKRKAPSRVRYEAEHPSLTVRVPAEVKAKIQQAADAEGLSVSEWVQAMAARHTPDVTAAYEKGRAAGRTEGEKAGYQRGRSDGEAAGRSGGLAAGLLEAAFLARQNKHWPVETVAGWLLEHSDWRAAAEAVLKSRGHGDALARLLRSVARSG